MDRKDRKLFFLRTFLLLAVGTGFLFQNCAKSFESNDLSSKMYVIESFSCAMGAKVFSVGEAVSGFSAASPVFPNLCVTVTRTCLASGQFDGPIPSQACNQFCSHPDSHNAVPAGSAYTYATLINGSLTECANATFVSRCDGTTGKFSPAVPTVRYNACLVQGQTCAYSAAAGYAVPTGNSAGSLVNGFKNQSEVFPNLCTRIQSTCQASGAWIPTAPLFNSCAQSCLNPDTSAQISSANSYSYYTRASGSASQCAAALKTSVCDATQGVLLPAVDVTRYSSCVVINLPVISSFVVSSSSIVTGQSATLSWSVSGATSLSIDQGVGSVTGQTSVLVSPTTSKTYILSATNSAGTVSSAVSINLIPSDYNCEITSAGDIWVKLLYKSQKQYDFRIGSGGAIKELRDNDGTALLAPTFGGETTDRVIQLVTWDFDITRAGYSGDPRLNFNQAGTSSNILSPTYFVKIAQSTNNCRVDVYSAIKDSWDVALSPYMRANSTLLTRYDISEGQIKIRRILYFVSLDVNAVTGISSSGIQSKYPKLYLENWIPFSVAFNSLVLAADISGSPTWWYNRGNFPTYPNFLFENTYGYAVVFNEAARTRAGISNTDQETSFINLTKNNSPFYS